jgi:thiol:disulfide interchange protein
MNIILARVFTKPFLVTIFRYALAAAGAWLVANGLTDEGTWEIIGGALLTIAVALMGGADSVKDKATYNGQTVKVSDMPASARAEIKQAVQATPKRSLIDILFGK